MIDKKEAEVILNFLDTSDCKGHVTRNNMNLICNKLIEIVNALKEEVETKEEE